MATNKKTRDIGAGWPRADYDRIKSLEAEVEKLKRQLVAALKNQAMLGLRLEGPNPFAGMTLEAAQAFLQRNGPLSDLQGAWFKHSYCGADRPAETELGWVREWIETRNQDAETLEGYREAARSAGYFKEVGPAAESYLIELVRCLPPAEIAELRRRGVEVGE